MQSTLTDPNRGFPSFFVINKLCKDGVELPKADQLLQILHDGPNHRGGREAAGVRVLRRTHLLLALMDLLGLGGALPVGDVRGRDGRQGARRHGRGCSSCC